MASANARVIRVLADMARSQELRDYVTQELPFFWKGETVQFDVLCALNGSALDLTGVSGLYVVVKEENDESLGALMLGGGAVDDPDATLADFEAGTGQHISVSFSKDETGGLTLSGDPQRFWMAVYGVIEGSPDRYITYAAGWIEVRDDGVVDGESGPVVRNTVEIDVNDSPYDVPDEVRVVLVDTTGGAVTVNLPVLELGREVVVKDNGGEAATNSITVDGGAATIEGEETWVISTDWGGVRLIGGSEEWVMI